MGILGSSQKTYIIIQFKRSYLSTKSKPFIKLKQKRNEVLTKLTPSTSSEEYETDHLKKNFVNYVKTKYHNHLRILDLNLWNDAQQRFSFPPEVKKYRNHIVSSLSKIMKGDSSRKLVQVGSAATGLAGPDSDIDLVLLTSNNSDARRKLSNEFAKNQALLKHYMNNVISVIRKSWIGSEFDWTKVGVISHARVPILSLNTNKGLKLDIQFDREESIRNTNFVRQCILRDPRVAVLIFWVQEWMKFMKLKNSRAGLFSSYHITMTVLHFLQNNDNSEMPPILPVMYEEYAEKLSKALPIERVVAQISSDMKALQVMPNKQPHVSELILRYIEYFSKIDLDSSEISVQSGQVTRRPDEEMDDTSLAITDPYAEGSVCTVRRAASLLSQAFIATKHFMIEGKCICWPISCRSTSEVHNI